MSDFAVSHPIGSTRINASSGALPAPRAIPASDASTRTAAGTRFPAISIATPSVKFVDALCTPISFQAQRVAEKARTLSV